MNQEVGNGRTQHADLASQTSPAGRDPGEIQDDIARTRSQLDQTIHDIQRRLTPEMMFDYVRNHGGRDLALNLGEAARRNPVPVALIGIGMAWLMMSGRDGRYAPHMAPESQALGRMRQGGQRLSHSARAGREKLAHTGSRVREQASALGSSAKQQAATVGSGAKQLGSSAKHQVASLRDTVADLGHSVSAAVSGLGRSLSHEASEMGHDMSQGTAHARSGMNHGADRLGDRMSAAGASARGKAHQARGGMERMMREQPLVLGALGLAVGAALGASLPHTRREDRMMGDASDTLEDKAKQQANLQLRKGKRAAESVADTAREEFGRAADEAAEDFKHAAQETRRAASSEAERQGLKK